MHNNFKIGDQANSAYKLMIQYAQGTPMYKKHMDTNGKVYRFSFNTGRPENRLPRLLNNCFKKHEDQIQTCILYDNQTKQYIESLK